MRRSHMLFGAACGVIGLVALATVLVPGRDPPKPTAKVDDPPASEADAGEPAEDAQVPAPPEPERVSECHATVLVYHHIQEHFPGEGAIHRSLNVTPAMLDRQLGYLEQHGYNVIPYERLVDCMKSGNDVPAKAVVLTFDDRWKTQYANAFPLLKKHKMTATFFVTTATDGPAFMSWADIKELSDAKMTIGSHTRTHPMLAQAYQDKALLLELKGSRDAIKEKLGKEPEFLAYPYGNFDKRVRDMTKEVGYTAARTVNRGNVHKPDDLFAMKAEATPEHLQAFAALLERK